MKKITYTFLILVLSCIGNGTEAKNLWAFLTYSTFNSPDGPYVETYLSVAGNSVLFVKKDNGKFQATVNVLMTFKQNNEIRAFKKYELNSQELQDTLNNNLYFVDQQRIAIPNGAYDFEIQLSDKNKPVAAVPFTQSITVDFPADKPAVSGIELVKSYEKTVKPSELSKSGYDLVPYTYTFFPESISKMSFYCELYNMDKAASGDKFIVSYFIESFESNLRLNQYSRIKKETPKPVNVILTEFDLANLPSGNFNLVVEARNQKNEVIASRKLFFQRNNPKAAITLTDIRSTEIANTFAEKITNRDTLQEYINSAYPIANGLEKAFIRESLKTADLKTMQQFFLSFWEQRDSKNPEQAWRLYNLEVIKAQANFGTKVKKGYQTDRGRVFLEYGAPNTRVTEYNEPGNYPYEIWHYYTLNNSQSNKKFVFYSPDMVTSDFFILHSDAIGEVYNPRWKIDLRERIFKNTDIQDTQVIEAWGFMEDEYYNNPY